MAEEKAAELDNKVRAGAVIKARGIRLTGLNARNKEVSRIRNAERVRVDFVLTANELTTPGRKDRLRPYHLARRLCADHRGDADLRVRGRAAELLGHA